MNSFDLSRVFNAPVLEQGLLGEWISRMDVSRDNGAADVAEQPLFEVHPYIVFSNSFEVPTFICNDLI